MSLDCLRHCVLVAFSILVLSGFGTFPAVVRAADEFPANWKELSPEDLVMAAYPYFNPDTERLEGNIDEEAVRRHCATLIANIDFTTSSLSYKVLDALQWGAFPYLDNADRTRIKNQFLARQDDWTDKPYEELNHKTIMMDRMDFSQDDVMREGRRWVQAGGRMADVPEDELSSDARYFFTATESRRIYGSFQVKWTGFLVAPTSGNYTLSLGKINSSSTHPERPVEIQGHLTVGGTKVLEPTAANWVRESAPVQLVAGELAPFELQMVYNAPHSASCAFHARLLWSGPNIEQQVVPYDALRRAEGDLKGVSASYTWIEDQQPQSLQRSERNIDYSWAAPVVWLSTDPFTDRETSLSLWRQVTAPSFLGSLQNSAGGIVPHPYFSMPDETVSTLSADQQKQFLAILLERPALLDALHFERAVMLYGAFRFAAPDEALQVLGTWAQRHPDCECRLPNSEAFEEKVRSQSWRTSARVAHDCPEHLQRLQADYLKLPNGGCSLPIAYMLGYAYHDLGRIEEWIEYLSQERENPALAGDQKVNWLIARAFTEEIRQGAPRVTDGMVWIDEARIVAQSADAHRRLLKEWAGRLMTTGQFDAAQDVLEQNGSVIADGDKAFLAEWKAQNDSLRQQANDAVVAQKAVAKKAYIEQLKARKAQAAAAGRTNAVSRYDAIISAAENEK